MSDKALDENGRCAKCHRSPEGCACDLTFAEKIRSVQVDRRSLHPDHVRIKKEARKR